MDSKTVAALQAVAQPGAKFDPAWEDLEAKGLVAIDRRLNPINKQAAKPEYWAASLTEAGRMLLQEPEPKAEPPMAEPEE